MDPEAIESMEEQGGTLSEILPYPRWLAWRPVAGALVPGQTVEDRRSGLRGPTVGAAGDPSARAQRGVGHPDGAEDSTLGVSSSGRMATMLELRAERSDDGLLVGPSGQGDGGKRIVWVADLALVPLSLERLNRPGEGVRGPQRPTFSAPIVTVGMEADVRVQWPDLPPGEYALRFTVLCRPDDAVTFENESFDSSVSVSARGKSTSVVIQPYSALDPVEIELHAEADLRVDPQWHRGVSVIGWDGTVHVEDRFSPGELRFQWSGRRSPLAVTARVLGSQVQPPRAPGPRGSTSTPFVGAPDVELAACPPARYMAAGWLAAAHAASNFPVTGPGPGPEPDAERGDSPVASGQDSAERLAYLLWRTRALALSVEGGRTADQEAFERASGECVEAAFARAGGGAIWRAVEGLPRWCEGDDPCAAPAVEHAALLHAVLVARPPGSPESAESRRCGREAAKLSRWFQDSFWLSTPRRLADRALPARRWQVGGDGLMGLMAMRPHMVIACSLAGAPMGLAQRRDVVRAAGSRLLTPMGLRTLDFEAESFDARTADSGLIFPWLLAPYLRASVLAFGLGRGRAGGIRTLLRALESAPEAWYLEPGRPARTARAVGAIGLSLHGLERRALHRLLGMEPSAAAAGLRSSVRPLAPKDSHGVSGEWVLR